MYHPTYSKTFTGRDTGRGSVSRFLARSTIVSQPSEALVRCSESPYCATQLAPSRLSKWTPGRRTVATAGWSPRPPG